MSDLHLCPDCEEPVEDGFIAHPSCCDHEDYLESEDIADGVVGGGAAQVWRHYCHGCGAELALTVDGWEVLS